MFSKACEYGIKATIHISRQSQVGEKVSLKAVAKAVNSPEAFTAKILQQLVNNGIISSSKGPGGGYEISDADQSNITLHHIVQAIDGDKIYTGCGLGLTQCNESKPCPIHFKFKAIREDLDAMLRSTYVYELTEGLHEGLAFLKR